MGRKEAVVRSSFHVRVEVAEDRRPWGKEAAEEVCTKNGTYVV